MASPNGHPAGVILIGDGLFGPTVIAGSTSPVYWWIITGLGVGFATLHLWRTRASPGVIALCMANIVRGSGAFWAACSAL
ncbi:DUF6518 family protein [Glaciibacter sp. 2TAF33]|uniref:DUF6518 family protein n=1 Tax=Glaciibacter sp. 2TAF33 TaxID=3233015 RepID=UPI003F8E5CDB